MKLSDINVNLKDYKHSLWKSEVVKHIVVQKIDDETYEICTCQHPSNYMYIDVKDFKELKEEVEKVIKSLK